MTETKKITKMTDEEIKEEVRKAYTKVAQRTTSCCGTTSSCSQDTLAGKLGYEVSDLPDSVTESFAGCGNPVALASLQEGDVVLDLGSGAGLDAFMAARKVGPKGGVIGVDMTTEMTEKARLNAEKIGVENVEFRQGDIEALPVENEAVDVIISNCVINLAPDKSKVFTEAFRVLRPGGRMLISDIVLEATLPKEVRDEVASYTGCLGGAILKEEYLQLMRDAGFVDVKIVGESPFNLATSAKIEAHKPK
jgi:SAM-dependent methyltransferase